MPQHLIKQLIHQDERITAIQGYGFYKSNAGESGLPGIWLPFLSVTSHGNIIPPPFVLLAGVKLFTPPASAFASYWFGERDSEIVQIIERGGRKKLLSRFGNLEALLISFALDEKAWEEHAKGDSHIKALIECINKNNVYSNYVIWFRTQFKLDSEPTKTYARSPEEMKRLLNELGPYVSFNDNYPIYHQPQNKKQTHSSEKAFPKFSDEMVQRIQAPTVFEIHKKDLLKIFIERCMGGAPNKSFCQAACENDIPIENSLRGIIKIALYDGWNRYLFRHTPKENILCQWLNEPLFLPLKNMIEPGSRPITASQLHAFVEGEHHAKLESVAKAACA